MMIGRTKMTDTPSYTFSETSPVGIYKHGEEIKFSTGPTSIKLKDILDKIIFVGNETDHSYTRLYPSFTTMVKTKWNTYEHYYEQPLDEGDELVKVCLVD